MRFRSNRMLVPLVAAIAGGCAPASEPEGANPFGDEQGSPTTADAGEITDAGESSGSPGSEGEAGSTNPGSTNPGSTASSEEAGSSGADASTSESSDASTDSSSGDVPGDSSSSDSSGVPASTESGETSNDGILDVEVSVQSMWQDGECDDVTVTNVSAMNVAWEIELELPGTIDMLWNAEVVEMDGIGTFTGAAFNADLDPGEAAMFGFCVSY